MSTLFELNNKFDLLYDSIASKQAPSLESYEKSLFLTQAYKELVKEFAPDVDKTEKRRQELDRLIINTYINFDPSFDANYTGVKISNYSRIFKLPDNVWYPLQESLYTSSTVSITVTPKTIDEYNRQIKNRFRMPNTREAWRLNVKDTVDEDNHIVEILSTTVPVKYQLRYIKKPKPIILEDLTVGYTIEGETSAMLPEVSDSLYDTIIKRAVILAVEAYKPQGLESKLAITNKEN